MSVTCRRAGFIISGLLHFAVAVAVVTQINDPFEKSDADSPLPLKLTMFEEAETTAPIIPEPVPETPKKIKPEKLIPEAKIPPLVMKPRPKPVTRVEPVIKLAVPPGQVVKNDSETVARPEPIIEAATEPVVKQKTAQAPRLSSQQKSLKQRYIKALLKRIHKKKHYPRRARRNGEEGKVLVSFVIGQTGDISLIQVSRSSGYSNLDKAAVKTLSQVSPLQPLPAELGMTRWELAVPIAFDLRK